MNTKQTASRYHDLSFGHRVAGHENKCAHLHGHNYRIHFHCVGDLDQIGRVLDFSVIKSLLCNWLEENWDHKFLVWEQDPCADWLVAAVDRKSKQMSYTDDLDWVRFGMSFVRVPFNPTAENIAQYLLEVVGPAQLAGTGVVLTKVDVEETRKCSASAERGRA